VPAMSSVGPYNLPCTLVCCIMNGTAAACTRLGGTSFTPQFKQYTMSFHNPNQVCRRISTGNDQLLNRIPLQLWVLLGNRGHHKPLQ
jgi:hypothetical protein